MDAGPLRAVAISPEGRRLAVGAWPRGLEDITLALLWLGADAARR
jgi:hypothetical protein